MIAILTLLLIGLVIFVVGAPVRRARRTELDGLHVSFHQQASDELDGSGERAREDLEAAREAKYREIRDAELDYRTGKLSREDYDAIDAELRAEAIEILNRLERLTPKGA